MAAAEASVDERVRRVGLVSILLSRPEIGAIIGAILVWVIFAVWAGDSGFLSWAGAATYLEVAAQVGIVAPPASMQRSGGEEDREGGARGGVMVMRVLGSGCCQ